jgi:hypothetical protein
MSSGLRRCIGLRRWCGMAVSDFFYGRKNAFLFVIPEGNLRLLLLIPAPHQQENRINPARRLRAGLAGVGDCYVRKLLLFVCPT